MTNIEGFGREFSAFTESISPDEEDLINGIEGIYLQLVVRISPIDEEFKVILQKDQRVSLRQTRLEIGLLGLESDIEVGLTPQDGAASSELCLLPRCHIDKRRAPCGLLPNLFGHNSINREVVVNLLGKVIAHPLMASSSIGVQEQMRLRSPYTPSIRPVAGQYLPLCAISVSTPNG